MKLASKGTNKICPKCGKGFTCYGEDDCWCENVQLPKKSLLFIMENYRDCLCEDCLRQLEDK